jgi:hypothetical protein
VNEGEAELARTLQTIDRVASAATRLDRLGRIASRASRAGQALRPVARAGRAVRPAAVASRRAPRAARAPVRNPNYPQLPAQAGTAIERGEVQRWAQRLGSSWEVIPRQNFGNRLGLARIFRGTGRPDMVAINRRNRQILVGDVTSQPDADHIAKTVAYAQRLAGQLPPEMANWRVLAQEWYWGLSPDWGRRGWPTSRRMPVG